MQKKRLIINRIDDSFDPKTDVAIGPWCFAGAEHIVDNWDMLEFQNFLSDPDKVAVLSAKLESVIQDQIHSHADKFNELHGTNYGFGYWSVLLRPCLINLLTLVTRRYYEVKGFLQYHIKESYDCATLQVSGDWGFRDYQDFLDRGLLSSTFNHWVTSVILEQLAPENIECRGKEHEVPQIIIPKDFGQKTVCEKAGLKRRILRSLIGERPAIQSVEGMGLFQYILVNMYANIKRGVPKKYEAPVHKDIDVEEKLLGVFNIVADKTMMRSLKDGFSYFDNIAKNKKYVPGRVFIPEASSFQISEINKFELAHAIENKERISSFQHGYGYGIAKNFLLFKQLEYNFCSFLTWGWLNQNNYDCKFIPVSAPNLQKYRKLKYSEQKNGVYFVGNSIMSTSYRFNSEPGSIGQVEYRKNKVCFLESLVDEIRSEVIYRQGKILHNGFEDLAYLRKKFPALKASQSSFLEEEAIKSRIAVMDHPGTTFANFMVMNHPVVGFWDEAHWPICEQATSILEKLYKVGIVHRTPNAAAEFLNTHWGQIEEWWFLPETQEARNLWLKHYGNVSTFWLYDWIRAINQTCVD